MKTFEQEIIAESKAFLRQLYFDDTRPWVVAFSGGKDSTLVLQLVLELMEELDESQRKPVYVICSDTGVEPPNVQAYVLETLEQISAYAKNRGLPLSVDLVRPAPEESFWGNLIGKGYPSPTRWFRWCTSKMKIKPTRRAIELITKQCGSVILMLGTRYAESAGRNTRMRERIVSEKGLNSHKDIPNALVATPIAKWSTHLVWDYLLNHCNRAWGGSYAFLYDLYKQATEDECPVVLDLNTPACGGSRFGCWTCTVVKEDKSMQGFIASGEANLTPLNELRNYLKQARDDKQCRMPYRRDKSSGLGPFTFEMRKMLLKRLLETEKLVGVSLITDEELMFIQGAWDVDFDFEHTALRIAQKFGRSVEMPKKARFVSDQTDIIEALSQEYEVQPELVEELLFLANEKHPTLDAYGAKAGLERDVRELIEKAAEQALHAD